MPDLTLREKAAQLVFVRFGSNMRPSVKAEEDLERVASLLEAHPLGGIVLFNGRWPETPAVLAELQTRSPYPLLVGMDMERGVGQQIKGATVFPHALAFSALGEAAAEQLEAAARVQAREALASGVHITFSPVADVNRNPRNPIISTRAFGTEPEGAAQLVQAYIRGCKAEGLLTTAKHFPGHGNTTGDSHAELPVVQDSRDELDTYDLVPFNAAIDAEVDLIMTAHVAFQALDPTGTPATASAPILTDLLRGEFGFAGAVITDSLLMGGIKHTHATPGEQAAGLIAAGVDILLDVDDPAAAIAGIVEAVEQGTLPQARLNDAVARVWTLKQHFLDRFGATFFTDPQATLGIENVASPKDRALAAQLAREAITTHGDSSGVLPLALDDETGGDLLVLTIRTQRSRLDPAVQPIGQIVQKVCPEATYIEIDEATNTEAFAHILALAKTKRHVVACVVVKPAAWHYYGLQTAQAAFLDTLTQQQPVILAAMGSPVVLDDFPHAAARLCTYSDVATSQHALAQVLGLRA
ncbi:MAG: glycoside hydrolase family 3 protein [Bacteroidota bacterium]